MRQLSLVWGSTLMLWAVSVGADAQTVVDVERSDGSASGSPASRIVYPLGGTPLDSVGGDFNGDRRADVVTSTSVGLLAHLGTGAGSFRAPVQSAGSPTSLTAGDFDGDGRLDVVGATSTPESVCAFTLFTGRGDGAFAASTTRPYVHSGEPGVRFNCGFVSSGDYNGDGKRDVVLTYRFSFEGLGNIQAGINVFPGRGDGTFGDPYTSLILDGYGTHVVATADLNGDRRDDLVFGVSLRYLSGPVAHRVLAYVSDGRGGFTVAPFVDAGPAMRFGVFEGIDVGDHNRDGKPDVALIAEMIGAGIPAGSAQNALTLRGNGDGTFAAPVVLGTTYGAQDVTTQDFNGDGRQDLVIISDTAGTLSFYAGNGDGSFQPQRDLTLGGALVTLVPGQYDGDGRLDLVVTERSAPSLTLLRNTGCTPPFSLEALHGVPWPWRCWR